MGEEYSVISASANGNARSAYTYSFTESEPALRRSSQYIAVLNCSVWRSFRRFSGSILSGNVFCKSVKMNLCVATDVAEFKHSRGKLLSIYFVLSESLPFFTYGDFSILHFFFCLLPHFPSIPTFVRNLFCVWKWLKCPSSNVNVLTKYCSSLVVIQSVESLTVLCKPKFRYLI